MVEGHSVHRMAHFHRQRLVGHRFAATSPNSRFRVGAAAIDGRLLGRVEAVGKNLFAFFGDDDENENDKVVVVHVHFGMAGNWAIYDHAKHAPDPPSPTCRLRLVEHVTGVTADLSAMTVAHGDMSLYECKRLQLGQDALRDDANWELLWQKVTKSSKCIGQLLMDQSYFAGVGNIFRAEILFKAGVHPAIAGNTLSRSQFDVICHHAVDLLRRGLVTGRIVTVDVDDDDQMSAQSERRRYIYNQSSCPRCKSRIQTWILDGRTCYACSTCQPLSNDDKAATRVATKNCQPFHSHCAPESWTARLADSGPHRLTVPELRQVLHQQHNVKLPKHARKAELLALYHEHCRDTPVTLSNSVAVSPSTKTDACAAALSSTPNRTRTTTVVSTAVSPETAAVTKTVAGESLAVEQRGGQLSPATRLVKSRRRFCDRNNKH